MVIATTIAKETGSLKLRYSAEDLPFCGFSGDTYAILVVGALTDIFQRCHISTLSYFQQEYAVATAKSLGREVMQPLKLRLRAAL